MNNYSKAMECFDKAIALYSNFADALNNRGNFLQIMKRYTAAIEFYEKVIEINSFFSNKYTFYF